VDSVAIGCILIEYPEAAMATKIAKWGNSLGVRIPKALADQIGVTSGTPVEFLVREGALVLRPTRAEPPRLDDLLARVTRTNRHSEIDTGDAVGREAW
jgi:antitoxin MazE